MVGNQVLGLIRLGHARVLHRNLRKPINQRSRKLKPWREAVPYTSLGVLVPLYEIPTSTVQRFLLDIEYL